MGEEVFEFIDRVHWVLTSIGFEFADPRDFGFNGYKDHFGIFDGINQREIYYESRHCRCIFWYEYNIFEISILMVVEYYPYDWEDKHDYRQVKFETFEEMLDYLSAFHTDFMKSIRKLKIGNLLQTNSQFDRNFKTLYYDNSLYYWIYR